MNKNYLNFNTDMADERVDVYKRVHNLSEIDGVKVTSDTKDSITTTTVEVINENGSKILGKEIGKYITIETPDVKYIADKEKDTLINAIFNSLKSLIKEKNNILIVGLGNIYVTPDALGPKVSSKIDITRHIVKFASKYISKESKIVSTISPGVLGTTGIETSEIVEGVAKKINPDVIIVVDSLASGSIHRIGNTVQLTDVGIVPGAGVKNERVAMDENKFKVPVIAIGVPTVVDMATITNDAIDKVVENAMHNINYFKKEDNDTLGLLNEDNRYNMIANILDTKNYMVTPKEIDDLIEAMSEIISIGINKLIESKIST